MSDWFRAARERQNLRLYRFRCFCHHIRRAWRYAMGTLTEDAAQTIIVDCERVAGWHALLTLTVDDTMELARETWADHPELRRFIAAGCAYVGHKWGCDSNDLHQARLWAIELAESYAAQEGVVFHLFTATFDPVPDQQKSPLPPELASLIDNICRVVNNWRRGIF